MTTSPLVGTRPAAESSSAASAGSGVPAEPAGALDPVATVVDTALAYLLSRCLHVATELGVADQLTEGALSAEVLAARVGAHAPSLARLLRALAARGIFVQQSDGRFANNAASALLGRDVMRDGVLLCGEVAGDGAWWRAVGGLRQCVQEGEPAFERQQGMGFFDYIAKRPECQAWFARGMANFAAAEDPAIAAAYDFSAFGHVVDVGAGQGGLLAQVLRRHPTLRATLFDLPPVAAHPVALAADASLTGRWVAAGGDFFTALPRNADAYVLKRILHDWSDEACVQVLRRCREAMAGSRHPAPRVLVVDAVLPEGNTPHPAKTMDILMMLFAGGRERTADEFAELLARAGLQLVQVHPSASTLGIVEARVA